MSTSTATIYNNMASEATLQAALADLQPNPDSTAALQTEITSGSRVSIHRLFMRLFAYCAKLQQDLFDLFKVEVEGLAKDGHYGTRRWFAAKALRFQYGDTLIITELDAGYATDNPAARIITHSAVQEQANLVVIKVAKAQGITGLQPLDGAELTAVNDYFQELRPPVQVVVLTNVADKVRMYGSVVYDGQLPLNGVQAAVTVKVRDYLKSLDFGGTIRLTDLKAAMLQATGVVDVRMDTVEVRTTGSWINVPRIHHTYAGHAAIDAGFPINATLVWQVGTV